MIKRTPAQLGRWLPLTAIRDDGLAALNDGRLLRAIRLEALAPLRMSVEQLEHASRAVGELAAHLPDRQSLQLITNAQPLDTEQLIDELHRQADDAHSALADDGLGERGLALERLALATAEGVLEHAQRRVAMQLEHLLVIPWHPARGTVRPGTITAPALATAIDELDAHTALDRRAPPGARPRARAARRPRPARARRSSPQPRRRTAPSTATRWSCWASSRPTATRRSNAAGRLRAALCRSHVTEQRGHLDVGGTAVLCRTVSSVPDHTWLGWLLHLMRSPYPFTLSVHWQAGRRATERQRARQRYRRIWGVQRGREMRLKAPDPEASEREREAAELNRELTATAGAGVYQVAITLALTHPDGNAVELQRHARELERDLLARTDARLHHPVFAQLPAWRSTWPLAHDPLRITPQVRHRQPRRHDTAGRGAVRKPVRDPAGVGPAGPDVGAARSVRPGPREPSDGHRRQVRRREDDVDEPDPRADPRAGRERRGDRPRRALRVPRLADPRRDLPSTSAPAPDRRSTRGTSTTSARSSRRRSSNTSSRCTASSSAARSRTAPTTSNPETTPSSPSRSAPCTAAAG